MQKSISQALILYIFLAIISLFDVFFYNRKTSASSQLFNVAEKNDYEKSKQAFIDNKLDENYVMNTRKTEQIMQHNRKTAKNRIEISIFSLRILT